MRKQIFFGAFFLLIVCQYAFSQITFDKSYRNRDIYSGMGQIVIADRTGYFLAGTYYKKTENCVSLYGTAIIRTNLYGDTLWTKLFPEPSYYINKVLITESNPLEYVFVSNPSNLITKADVKITKADSLGNIIWSKTIVKPNYDESNQIIQTNDKGYLITGYSNSLSGIITPYYYDAYIIKLNSQGDTLWTKLLGVKENDDYACQAIETSDSLYLVTGFGEKNNNMLLIKMKANGDTLWVKKYSKLGYNSSVAETMDKNYIITGTNYINGNSFSDIYALKVNKDGRTLWEKSYHFNTICSVSKILTLDTGFIIAGENNDDAFLLKISDEGDLLWSKTIKTFSDPLFSSQSGGIASIDKCVDGGFIFTNKYGFSLIKTDAEGCVKPNVLAIVGEKNVTTHENIDYKVNNVRAKTYAWKSNRGNILSGQGTDSIIISWDKVGLDTLKVFAENDCGIDSTTINVNIQECVPLNMSKIQDTNNYSEFYINKYEGKSPDYLWNVDKGIILSGQNSNHIVVNWLEFGNLKVVVKVINDCSIIEDSIQFIYNNIEDILSESEYVKVYPNPAKNELKIDSYGLIIRKLEIFDIYGKLVNTESYNGKSINVLSFPQGIYFVKIETDRGIVIKKFIKR